MTGMQRWFLFALTAAACPAWSQASPSPAATVVSATPPKTAAASYLDARRLPPLHGDARAGATKAAACMACHGPDGNALLADFPSIAGQSADYLYMQLHAFKDGGRDNPIMKGMVAALSDQDMRDIAAYFASQSRHATAVNAAAVHDSAEVQRGQSLFLDGDPARGVPPCQGCHGRTATGHAPAPANGKPYPDYANFPYLAGQPAAYLEEQLRAFRQHARRGNSNAFIMQGVTQNLDGDSMKALATWLSQEPPGAAPRHP